jgi:predicted nucleotidyltransferase
MRIKSGDIVAGRPALEIRRLFKCSHGTGSIHTIAEILHTSPSIAQTIYQNLLQEGYIELRNEPFTDPLRWQTTIKGNALAYATARRPITRQTADKLVEGFLERTKNINACADYAFYVQKVIVFGSYLSDRSDLGDVDLAVTLEFRHDDIDKRQAQFDKRIQHAIDQGRIFKNIVERYGWPQIEIFRILKASLPSLSLHDAKSQEAFLQSVPSKILFEANEKEIIRDNIMPQEDTNLIP